MLKTYTNDSLSETETGIQAAGAADLPRGEQIPLGLSVTFPVLRDKSKAENTFPVLRDKSKAENTFPVLRAKSKAERGSPPHC